MRGHLGEFPSQYVLKNGSNVKRKIAIIAFLILFLWWALFIFYRIEAPGFVTGFSLFVTLSLLLMMGRWVLKKEFVISSEEIRITTDWIFFKSTEAQPISSFLGIKAVRIRSLHDMPTQEFTYVPYLVHKTNQILKSIRLLPAEESFSEASEAINLGKELAQSLSIPFIGDPDVREINVTAIT